MNPNTCPCPHKHQNAKKTPYIAIGAICAKQFIVLCIWAVFMSVFVELIPQELFVKGNLPLALTIMFTTLILALSLHSELATILGE
jgi:hypothetical protein